MFRKKYNCKTLCFVAIALLNPFWSSSQEIKKVAVYQSSNNNSGIYAISDTCVYNYSWYYSEWLPFENNGLPRQGNLVSIREIAVYEKLDGSTSGLFVISDTAVYNYDWYLAEWFALPTNGLIRINNQPSLDHISAFYETAGSASGIHVVSGNKVFRYDWYLQKWLALPVIGTKTDEIATESPSLFPFPNPANDYLKIPVPEIDNAISVAIFSAEGKFVKEIQNPEYHSSKTLIIDISDLLTGSYFYELSGSKTKKAQHFFKIH